MYEGVDYFVGRPNGYDMLTDGPTNYIGAYMRTLTTQEDSTGVVRPLLALEIIMEHSDASAVSAQWMAKLVRLYADALDLSAATTISFRYKVICDATTYPTLTLEFGEADLAHWAGHYATAVGDLSQKNTPWAVTNKNVWYTEDWTISGITAADRTEVLAFALSVDTTDVKPVARLEPTVVDLVESAKDYAIYILIDFLKADNTPTSFIVGQEYNFCYTYVYTDGQESAPSDITQSLVPTATTDLPKNMIIGITKDDGSTATRGRFYGRGGVLGLNFILLQEVVF
jgi:hypothetical protein